MNRSAGRKQSQRMMQLTTGGITLLGVLLSVGVTVGFSVGGGTVSRISAGLGTTLALVALVKLGTRRGRGPIARAARWVISEEGSDPDDQA